MRGSFIFSYEKGEHGDCDHWKLIVRLVGGEIVFEGTHPDLADLIAQCNRWWAEFSKESSDGE